MMTNKLHLNFLTPIAWLMVLGTSFSRLAFFLVMPFLAIHLDKNSDLSFEMIGLIMSAGPLAGIIFGYLAGNLSDRIGRKKLVLISHCGIHLCFMAFAFTESPLVFGLLNFALGSLSSIGEPALMALVRDQCSKEVSDRSFKLRYTGINAAAAFGSILGGFVGPKYPVLTFLVAAAIEGIYFCVIFMVTRHMESREEKIRSLETSVGFLESLKTLLRDRSFSLFVFANSIIFFAYSQVMTTLALDVNQGSTHLSAYEGSEVFGLLLTVNGITVLSCQWLLGHLLRSYNKVKQSIIATLIMSSGYILFAYDHKYLTGLLIAMILVSAGESLLFPSLTIITDDLTPSHMRGSYYGAAGLKKIGFVLGGPVGGYLLNHFGRVPLWLITTGLCLMTILFLLAASRSSGKGRRPSDMSGHVAT